MSGTPPERVRTSRQASVRRRADLVVAALVLIAVAQLAAPGAAFGSTALSALDPGASPTPSPTGALIDTPIAIATATPSPTPTATPTATPSTSSPAPSPTATATPVPTSPAPAPRVAAPVARTDTLVAPRGRSAGIDVLRNDTCSGRTPCPRGALTSLRLTRVPAGWRVALAPSTGMLSVRVPASQPYGKQLVSYAISDRAGSASASVVVQVVPAAPDSYNPRTGTFFSHPFRRGYKNRIRDVILRSINSVPYGGQIRLTSWSFSSKAYRDALYAAKKRGVSVQIVISGHNTPQVSDWASLRRQFGTSRAVSRTSGSWVYRCAGSCRGVGGNAHSKIFMFSRSASTPWVVMTGSANLTDFAVTSQWNQMSVVTGNAALYADTLNVFYEMRADRPAHKQYLVRSYPDRKLFFYPRGWPSPKNDFMMSALSGVRCTGASANPGGRTQIRIAMYAWFESRGGWLAKRVRQLWDQGCDVRIVYSVMSDVPKRILYSPGGRGRIPMRQLMLTNRAKEPIYYLHDKWVAIDGHVGSQSNVSTVLQGSFNFTNLGFRSDENFEQQWSPTLYAAYLRDFRLLWTEPQSRAPSPTSSITSTERAGSPDLGRGRYTHMNAD